MNGSLADLVLLQRIEHKRFAFLDPGFLFPKLQADDLLEKKTDRMAPEPDQRANIDESPFRPGWFQGGGEEEARLDLAVGGLPGPVVTGSGGRTVKTARAEGLHRVFGGQVINGGSLRDDTALVEIILQLADHH